MTATGSDAATATPVRDEHGGAAPVVRRVLAQAAFETRAVLRNGEQLLITLVVPVVVLVALTRATAFDVDTGGRSRIDLVAPGVLALAVMTTAFTSQAIATAFDRRNGVLRLLATTPLGRGGLLAGKILGVLAVEVTQVVVLGGTALALGWHPDWAGVLPGLLVVLLGTAAFASLALLLAGTLRAEAVLAFANLLLVLLAVLGGVVLPTAELPSALAWVARILPSGALGEAMRGAAWDAAPPVWALGVLAGWTVVLVAAVRRFFRWA